VDRKPLPEVEARILGHPARSVVLAHVPRRAAEVVEVADEITEGGPVV
jgi:hypothetical protein